MYTVFNGRVYSMGDGFCYEGIVFNRTPKFQYHFVIDYGSQAPIGSKYKTGKLLSKKGCDERLEEVADEIAKNGDTINLFIVTHLHKDHFNGYEALFKKTKIDTIIMPYLYPEERLFLILNSSSSEDESVLLARPYLEALRLAQERNSNVQLVLIRGNDHYSDEHFIGRGDPDNPDIWGEEHPDSENMIAVEGLNQFQAKVVNVASKGVILPEFSWFFKLFNLEIDKEIVDILRKLVGKLDSKRLHDIVTDKTELTKIQAKYKKLAESYSDDLNNTSVIIYHGPDNPKNRCGTLITGDIVLKRHNIAQELLDYYADELKWLALFSIPHHGSEHNWTKKFIDNGSLNDAVCFASTYNYYSNRMTANMMSDLRCHNIEALVVDENRFSEFVQLIEIREKLSGHHFIIKKNNSSWEKFKYDRFLSSGDIARYVLLV